MEQLVLNNIGYLLCLSEIGPQTRKVLLQNAHDKQLDAISSVCLNIVFEKIKLEEDVTDQLAQYGPLMLLLSDRSKGRSIKKSSLLRYPKFVSILFKGVRADLLKHLKSS